jgi:hypothetical protein
MIPSLALRLIVIPTERSERRDLKETSCRCSRFGQNDTQNQLSPDRQLHHDHKTALAILGADRSTVLLYRALCYCKA